MTDDNKYHKIYQKEYKERNREKLREYSRKHNKKHQKTLKQKVAELLERSNKLKMQLESNKESGTI